MSRMIDLAPYMVQTKRPPARLLFLPPAGRPRWVCPENAQLDLLYLSWGKRRFGASAVPVSRHPGCIYIYVNHGAPHLRLVDRAVPTRTGDVLIIDADCASGWDDEHENVSELITWVWRTPPRCVEIAPATGSFRKFQATGSLRKILHQTHRLCRSEVALPDPVTKNAIEQLRLQLDVAIVRSQQRKMTPPQPELRFELSLRWLAQNPTEPHPVTALCRYLRVSPMTLNRLFHAHLGESVAAWHHRSKMQRARELMNRGAESVKQIGYLLGYKHPNDFSRAIKKATGESASAFLHRTHGSSHR